MDAAAADTKTREISRAAQPVIRHGQAAWRRLAYEQTWQDWLSVGEALEAGREQIEQQIRERGGGNFNRLFGSWLDSHGFGGLHKSVRSRLHSCMEHREAIEKWRQSIGKAAAAKLNHPHAIWHKFKLTLPDGPKRKKPQSESWKEAYLELLGEHEKLQRQLIQAQRDRDAAEFERDAARAERDRANPGNR